MAFALWCLLVSGAIVTATNYRRSATDSPSASLRIDRGIVLYQDGPVSAQIRGQSGMELAEGGVLEASEATAGTIELFDGTQAVLHPSARLQLSALRTGKFNPELTRITLKQDQGAVRYQVSGQLPFGRDIGVSTPHAQVNLGRGEFLVWVDDEATRVLGFEGRGRVDSDVRQVRFREGQRVVVSPSSLPRDPLPIAENLIRNGELTQGFELWKPFDVQERGRSDVGGNRSLEQELIAGRRVQVAHFTRDTKKDTHHETGLIQEINRDVSAYRTVNLTAWVKINSASLSGGGYLGSEYPMLFRVHFVDDRGGRQVWSHGFYYANPEDRPTDIAEQIPRGEWYPYVSRLAELPDRPAFIKSIEVLASGHDFDSMVGYLQLIVE